MSQTNKRICKWHANKFIDFSLFAVLLIIHTAAYDVQYLHKTNKNTNIAISANKSNLIHFSEASKLCSS